MWLTLYHRPLLIDVITGVGFVLNPPDGTGCNPDYSLSLNADLNKNGIFHMSHGRIVVARIPLFGSLLLKWDAIKSWNRVSLWKQTSHSGLEPSVNDFTVSTCGCLDRLVAKQLSRWLESSSVLAQTGLLRFTRDFKCLQAKIVAGAYMLRINLWSHNVSLLWCFPLAFCLQLTGSDGGCLHAGGSINSCVRYR